MMTVVLWALAIWSLVALVFAFLVAAFMGVRKDAL